MSATMQYQVPVTEVLDAVSAENVAYVADVLRQKYGQPGKHKEELVFEVNFYIPDNVVSPKDKAELVAKLIVGLQRSLPMEGMLGPKFPDKVEIGYLGRVKEFLKSKKGRDWIGSMLQLASNHDVGGTNGVGRSNPVQQMDEKSHHPHLYSPSGYDPVAVMLDTSPNETAMKPISATSVFDRPSGLVSGVPRAYDTMSDTGGRFGIGELGRKILNKPLNAALRCFRICVVIGFPSIIFVLARAYWSQSVRERTFGSPWSPFLSQSIEHVMSS